MTIQTPDLATLQGAAVKYRGEILLMMVLGMEEAIPYMEEHAGVRYKEFTPELSSNAELRPYSDSMTRASDDTTIKARCLETFFGVNWTGFNPTDLYKTVLSKIGEGTQLEDLTTIKIARDMLRSKAKSISKKLNDALWSASRNDAGTTSATLFNGFDTITTTEKTAGNISALKGNYMHLATAITDSNAVDIFDEILTSLSPELRANGAYIFCSYDIYDKYCRCYRNEHGSVVYNTAFSKTYLDGSMGKIEFVPLSSKANSSYITIAPKSNMLIGYDNMGADTNVEITKGSTPFTLDFVASSFFGVNFATLDKSMLFIAELADTTNYTVTLAANNASYGTVSPAASNTVAAGGRLQIGATAATGYHFTKWSDENTDANRVIVVNGNMTLTATFAADEAE